MAPRNENTVPVAEWVARLEGLIKKKQHTTFELGDALIEMREALPKKDFAAAIKQTGISKSHAENLMRVAKKAILRTPEIENHLPISTGALIDLAAWADDEIIRARDDGALKRDATRSELQAWIELQAVPADPSLIQLTKTSIPRDNAEPSLLGYIDRDDWTRDQINEWIKWVATETEQRFSQQVNFELARHVDHNLHLKEVRAQKQLPCMSSPSLADHQFEETADERSGNV